METGKFADLVLWDPRFFGVKPENGAQGRMIAASRMGDAMASIPTTEPVAMQHMFGAHGTAKSKTCLTFVSKVAA